MKKYLDTDKDNLKTRIEVYYDIGSKDEGRRRGYYLSVSPVEMEDKGGYIVETYTGYTGVKMLLLEVTRKSNKKYEEAIEIAEQEESYLVSKLVL